ncbi:MAG: PA2779 family protein [Gammaproteobacteria bacterium]|nr:PA2779 family protein [Gammaproteobacteria bacterium]NIR96794.1 PA2779 family protein [Gammaproteobacteria bacterium]NIT62494.1 PA2779 family protein [Gammaproteobacteria bacterium]NIV19434.1 PA2779 family protein [Gammaproteobacteria bacterium]NIX10517.1 PA2779 family protein [Gammaproteobacteria bacterium]
MQAFRNIARPLATALTASMLWLGVYAPSAQAALVGTQQVVDAKRADHARARLRALYEREEVVAALEQRGVDPAQAQARTDSLTDAEVLQIAGRIDQMEAGAGPLEFVLIIFLVLVITDLLGYTNIFSFVRSSR